MRRMKLHALNQWCEPLTIPLHQSCFPFLRRRHTFPKCLVCLVLCLSLFLTFLSYCIHLSNAYVVTSFRALLQFHCLCHFRLCCLSSLSTLDSFLNKPIVIYLRRLNKSSCLQLWFYNIVVTFWKNETLSGTSSRHSAASAINWVVLPSLPFIFNNICQVFAVITAFCSIKALKCFCTTPQLSVSLWRQAKRKNLHQEAPYYVC